MELYRVLVIPETVMVQQFLVVYPIQMCYNGLTKSYRKFYSSITNGNSNRFKELWRNIQYHINAFGIP